MPQDGPAPRRRAPRRPPPPGGAHRPSRRPAGPEPEGVPARRGPNRFRGLIAVGATLVAVIVAVGLATGAREDLPWGAIIGVVVLLLMVYLIGRRQAPPAE